MFDILNYLYHFIVGFTEGENLRTWLPVNPGYWKANVEVERNATDRISHLQIFSILTSLRKNIVFQEGDYDLKVIDTWVLVLTR